MHKQVIVGGLFLVSFVGCSLPGPRAWLRFQPSGPHDWSAGPDGTWTARMHGADVAIDLNRTQTRAQVVVTNRTVAPLDFRLGPMAGAPRGAIGEVLLRPIDGPSGGVGPEMQPYISMQKVVVDDGWRATFYLDTPTGADPQLGTYFVLTVEARNPVGDLERRSMPLIATNAGTMPADGR